MVGGVGFDDHWKSQQSFEKDENDSGNGKVPPLVLFKNYMNLHGLHQILDSHQDGGQWGHAWGSVKCVIDIAGLFDSHFWKVSDRDGNPGLALADTLWGYFWEYGSPCSTAAYKERKGALEYWADDA